MLERVLFLMTSIHTKGDMVKLQSPREMAALADKWRRDGESIGCVPTMGCLHEGHLSLIKMARDENSRVVVTIFVNPIQFAEGEDLDRYPKTLEQDIQVLSAEGVDCLFFPSASEMYPEKTKTFVSVGGLTEYLCGKSRKNHFRGVTTVVTKLLNLTKPHTAYFGQKDYQQYTVLKQMLRDLNFDVNMRMGEIVRESDGLAMSSRNRFLTLEERKAALSIYKSLEWAKKEAAGGKSSVRQIKDAIVKKLSDAHARVDYVAVVDAETLEEKQEVSGKMMIGIAAFFGSTRLIDNCLVRIDRELS